jgi:DNA-binding Xre family transcriptional regulator
MRRRRLKVKEVAAEKKISMGKLSRSSDVSYRTIKLIYDDPFRDVSLDTLDKIAVALDVEISDLIEYVDGE